MINKLPIYIVTDDVSWVSQFKEIIEHKYSNRILVLNNNQDIINESDWVFLSVTPEVGHKILPELKFKKNQTNLSERLDALDETDLLVISKPTSSFSVKEQYVIDQFIMNGGKVIWLIDMMDVNEAALAQNNVLVQNDVY